MFFKEWPSVPLRSLCREIQPGFARVPTEDGSGVLQVRMPNISPYGYLDWSIAQNVDATLDELEFYRLQAGDIIFNNTNSPDRVGNAAAFDGDESCVFSNHVTRVRVRLDVLNPSYVALLLHYLWTLGVPQQRAKRWVNQAAVDKKGLGAFEIPTPPLSEQQRIVEVLYEAEAVRRLRAEAERKTAELIPALFYEMFGDPVTNPKNWNSEPLRKCGELDRGRSRHRPRDEPSLFGGPYPFIQTGDVASANGWILRYTQTYSEVGLAQSRLWPNGTLCITIAANIAATSILTFDACFPDSVVGFTPNERVTVEYVKWCFECFRADIERRAPAGAQKNINLDFLRKLRLPIPNKELQLEFSRRVQAIRDVILDGSSWGNSGTVKLAELRASLLARAFTGELTAEWREQHVATLRAETHDRDEALRAAGVRVGQRATIQEINRIVQPPGPEDARYVDLNAEQLLIARTLDRIGFGRHKVTLFNLDQLAVWLTDEFSHDELAQALAAAPEMLRAPLDVLAARGLVHRYQRRRGKGDFATLYRMPWLENEEGKWTWDEVRAEELERLAAPTGGVTFAEA